MRLRWTHLTFLVIAVLLVVAPAAAHEGRVVGDYELVFGWRSEPAYAGMMNGPELTISLHHAEHGEAFPEGIEVSLQYEVSFGSETLTRPLRAAWNQPGHFVAELVPTLPGDYSFRVFGRIGDTEIDEVFTSADGEFSSVEPSGDILFPSVAGLEARLAALEGRIAELEMLLAAQDQ